jgi:glycosyltransferase involved in cell wall biosynthesis
MNQHILVYSENPQVGGVAEYNHQLLCCLRKAGYQVTSVQSRYSGLKLELEERLGVNHIWLDFDAATNFEISLKNFSNPQNLFKTIKPDLIFFSDGWVMSDFAAKRAAKSLRIPYMIVLGIVDPYNHKFTYNNDGINYNKILTELYQGSEKVIAVSQENLNLLVDLYGLPQDKGKVIHYGRPSQFFQPQNQAVRQRLRTELEIPESAIVCLTTARFTNLKGYEYLIEAINDLRQDRICWKDLYFLWVGGGDSGDDLRPYLEEIIDGLGIGERVRIIAGRTDMPDILDASDIFVLSSKLEGMPLSIMEAMAKALPVVASAVSGIPEELGNTGQLLPSPTDYPDEAIDQLVTTIKLWVTDSNLRSQVGQDCQLRAMQLFKEELMFQNILSTVLEVFQNIDKLQLFQKSFHFHKKNLVPKVTICLPTYNSGRFLAESLDSILEQKFLDFELIICDDNSTDNTPDVLEKYAALDPRIKYYKNPARLGLFSNWNQTLKYARGEYITIFAQDDIMKPENIEKKVEILDNYSSVGLVTSSIQLINEDNLLVSQWGWAEFPQDEFCLGRQWVIDNAGKTNPMCAPFTMFRKTILERVGVFNPQYLFAGDYEMWLRIALVSDLYFLSTCLGCYRTHDTSETQTLKEELKLKEQFDIWSYIIDLLNLEGEDLKQIESRAFYLLIDWFTRRFSPDYIRNFGENNILSMCQKVQNWRGHNFPLDLLISRFCINQ